MVSTTEPHPPDHSEPSRTVRGETTTRGVILEIRNAALILTVMPADGPPYRARIAISLADLRPDIRVGSYVELIIGADPSDIRLADDPPPAA